MVRKHPLNWLGSAELLFIVILFLSLNAFAEPLIQTGFDSGADGFSYQDDSFRSTSAPAYADGSWNPTEAALQIDLGGIDKSDIFGMSGGWQRDFELGGLSEVVLSFRYNLTQSAWYESNEQSQILVSIDGVLIGVSPNDYIDQVTGNGNGGPDETTGWQSVELNLGSLSAGSHRLTLGGYNNQKTHYTEYTTLLIDDLSLNALSSNQPPTAVASATPDNGVAPLEVSFSSAGSTDADGSIQSYSWRFGDGSSATDANPSHSYTSPGSYTATLTVTDDQGGTGSASVTISVSDVPDTEAPGTPTGLSASANGPATINLSWSAATDNVGVTGYRIFRDETEIATATTTSYSDSGLDPETTYSYSVTAYDAAGNESAPGEAAEATSGALPVLTSLSLNPSSAALSVGTSQQFSASGLDQYGNAIATSPVWSVSGGGTIDQTGRFTASSAGGPFTVLADDGGISASATVTITQNTTLIETGFDSDSDGFSYVDDAYRGTSAPGFADGSHQPAGGFSGGGLEVVLGGINGDDIFGMSGGWQRDFELGGLSEVTLSFRYNLTQSPFYEDNEFGQILVSLDGVLIGVSPNDHIDQISGNGNGGPDETTGWQQVELNLGSLSAGTHTLILGGYNNQKTAANESTRIQLDDLLLRTTSSNQPPTAVASATPDNGVAPLEVSFSSAGSTDADGSIQSYSWRFGDGSSASEANPSHSYTSPGSYTATLTVTDDQGGTGSASVTISVSDVPDTEAPGTPTGLSASANGPATINLSWSAATDNVGVTGYRIFRDETEIATATTTSYSDSGLDPETTYSYSVTAYDAAGNESAPGEAAEATTGALPVLTSLSLNPSSAALSVGTSQQFSASGLDQYGNAIATSPVWSVSGGGTIDQTGRFTASSAGGPFTVLADDGGISASATVTITQNTTLIETGFDSDSDGFSYVDDAYRGTSAPGFADGSHQPAGGFSGGGLEVVLGGINGDDIFGMSGGWQRDFELGGLSEVTLSFRYNLTQSPFYEDNEFGQILVSLDGVLIGVSPNDHIDQISGNGNGGPDETTGWQQVELNLGSLSAGTHTLILGGYNNQKTAANESTRIQLDDLLLRTTSSNQPPTAVASATPDNGVAPLEVSFSSAGSTDADGSIQSYSWRFGDGSSASEANPSHSYTSPGSYTATLTVTDDQGGTGSASVTISVSDVPDTEAPGTPTGLSASANGPATISLSWSAATDNVGVTGYRIFRDETEIATATTTSYSDSGLDPETTYSYSVTAYDAAGNESAPGEAAEATTGALPVLTSLSLNPSSAALSVGTSQQFSASGLDQYGNAIATSPVWSVSGGGPIDQTGRFTASSAGGPFTVLADDGGISASATVTITQNTILIETGFDSDSDGFSYVDDAYRGTSAPGFADGSHQPAGGFSGGGLEVVLGGINGDDIFGMSGGWQRDFELGGLSEVTLSFRYNLTQSPFYEDNELSQILISLDGVLIGVSPNDHIDQISGNGNGGPDETTGWQQVELNLGSLSAGTHTLILGGYNNQKTAANESTRIQLDDLLLRTTSSNQPPTAVASATPDNGVAPLEVSFSSAGSTDADGSIQSYSWRFGDGSSASEANPSHSYTSPGSYTATLTVTDDQGGSDSSSLMIVVAEAPDTVAPVITLNGGSSVTREAGPVAYSDPGATASDDRDGDLSANLQASGSVDHTTAGTYTLTYQVADAAGNQATVTRTVIVVAGSAPVITLLGDNPMILQAGDTFVDPGATANDTFDGDLSGSIVVSGVIDSSTAGSYTVTYSVTDAAGNSASASRSVEVVDSSDPVITLEGDNPVAIEAGTPFIDPGASAEDDVDGDITDRILVDGEVDIEAAGSYQLTYTVSDSAGNTATVIRTVNVVAASAPIIVLLGDNPYEVELGVEFSDPGATANDAFDGDISDRIEVTGSVDSGSVGSYMLVYSVSDNAGNSTEEMRTVLVVENPPVEFNVSNNIHVDQFGYLPDGEKVAVIAAPQEGFNSADTFAPGSDYQVRRTADDSIAFIGALTQWNEGATNDQSGDKAWWFDFSELTETGEFYVYDPENEAASHPFDIRADVYTDVLKQAVRSYFYQRVNFAKQEPYADPRWVDSASHGGAEQDYDVRAMIPEDPESSDPATGRDLHGGWYDAGDYNKYINYADGTVHNLLYAYQERPAVWGDDYQIPESGNGVPDLLDEVRWEMEWMLRMQIEDGSVLHKLASINWNGGSPPSSDVTPRRYAPPTASATISAAGAYAHAALVYSDFNAEFAGTLRQAALDAWDWLEENPESIPSNFDNAGFVNAAAEDCGYDDARCESHQLANRLNAAIHLFALTGEQRFQDYILAHAESDALLLGEGGYLVFDGMQQEVQDALIYYAGLDGADAGLVETIQAQLLRAMSLPEEWVPFSPLARFQEQKDPYRAYLDEHHWGSNRGKGNAGNLMFSTAESGFDPGNSGDYGSAAQGYLHYLHGVNPHNIAYLSNMDEFGADNSVPEFYHLWFNDGSELWDGVENSLYGPAPGYLVGGPNEHYWRDGVYIDDIEDAAHRLNNQPSMKRYWSWNGSENSYEITENSITYQAPYIRLLSKYLPGSSNEIWRPAPGTSWQWQINSGEVDTSFNVDMYDVDLFEASGELIASLKAQGRVVICYFSAGSFEDWRSDAEDFPASVIGNQLDEWPGESWLDIRDIDQLGPIMAARLDLAVAKGCDGVEPDNVDGYTNSSGFELTGEDQLAYNRWLAAQAHQRGLSIGLKNDLNQIEALLDDFDWALNEQCFEYEECDLLMPFIEAGKAVFGVTYGDAADAICPVANEMGFSWLMKNWDLDAWRIDCLEYGGGE